MNLDELLREQKEWFAKARAATVEGAAKGRVGPQPWQLDASRERLAQLERQREDVVERLDVLISNERAVLGRLEGAMPNGAAGATRRPAAQREGKGQEKRGGNR